MSDFKKINASDINESVFDLIGKDWALVTSGNSDKFNTMTISWGGAGIMWGKPVAFTFIRPQRYTCLLYTSPSPRDRQKSRMPSSA